MVFSQRKIRFSALALLLIFIFDIANPTVSFALTSGPAQPEFSSFEPVSTTNLVNDFSGGFVYNIPLLEVPGPDGSSFPIGLSYHSGGTVEEEASWVGYGWTLNPGAINRSKSGTPDDWNSVAVSTYNKTPANVTTTVGINGDLELFSYGFESGYDLANINASAGASLRHNNYKGFSIGTSFGIGGSLFGGLANLGYRFTDGEGSWSLTISPAQAIMSAVQGASESRDKKKEQNNLKAKSFKKKEEQKKEAMAKKPTGVQSLLSTSACYFPTISPGARSSQSFSFITPGYVGQSYKALIGWEVNPLPVPLGIDISGYGEVNIQNSVDQVSAQSFGLLYSRNKTASSMSDYLIERASPFTKRDKYLAIPYSTPDIYNVIGEGLAGSFQFYPSKVGSFSPKFVSSHSNFFSLGFEIQNGLDNGGGVQGSVSNQAMTTGGWGADSNDDFFPEAMEAEGFIPVFNGDLGASFTYGTKEPEAASMSGTDENVEYSIEDIENELVVSNLRERKSHIGFSYNSQFSMSGNLSTRNYQVETHGDLGDANDLPRESTILKDQIGEIYSYSDAGQRFVYGIPVYTGKEESMSYDTRNISFPDPGDGSANKYLGYKNTETTEAKTKIGHKADGVYASTYLLTEITDPNYVDILLDGPTEDDFGAWTKFNYDRVYGGFTSGGVNTDNWYKYRFPYNGLIYNRNKLSEGKDDLLSKNSGYKEVYYLSDIETKTHRLEFITSDRSDGIDAHHNEGIASGSISAKGSNHLKQLEEIRLYKKNGGTNDELIKTVHLDYYTESSEQAFPNAPNADDFSGKLTLKRVWFDYGDVKKARISPYEFKYTYPSDDPYPYPYEDLNPNTSLNETPMYSPYNTDAWGNYQSNGANRYSKGQSWLNQNPAEDFDPAAWQLKQIVLPSGGEIHVQYEQKDYTYVQDQRAHYLHSLYGNGAIDEDPGGRRDFTLRFNGDEEAEFARDLIHYYYISPQGPREKMYFKFLYLLAGNGTPDYDLCNVEYIEGFFRVESVHLDEDNLTDLVISIPPNDVEALPRKVCKDYVKANKRGDIDANCDPLQITQQPLDYIMDLIGEMSGISQIFQGLDGRCSKLSSELSYLRVPTLYGKKGGGIRVKRIISTDQSFATAAGSTEYKVMYGREYTYQIKDPLFGKMVSSGVAENEPATLRDENILVKPIKYFEEPSWFNKLVAGDDLRKFEGPIGENVLPGASVGHSRVSINSIHKNGPTATGTTIKEFYTAYDYPFKYKKTPIKIKDHSSALFTFSPQQLHFATQGYTFYQNDFHGKPKAVLSYNEKCYGSDQETLVGAEYYSYYPLGSSIPSSNRFNGTFNSGSKVFGESMDITFAHSQSDEIVTTQPFNFDATLGSIALIFIPFLFNVANGGSSYALGRNHVTTKVVSNYAVPKQTMTYQNGIYHIEKNLVHDERTGEPIITQTYDGYQNNMNTGEFLNLANLGGHKANYTNYNIPAHFAYSDMGAKAANQGVIYATPGMTKVLNDNGSDYIEFGGSSAICGLEGYFNRGDLIEMQGGTAGELYHIADFDYSGSNARLILNRLSYVTNYPSNGSSMNISFRVVKSGATNQLVSQAGNIRTYGGLASGSLAFADEYPEEFGLREDFVQQLNTLDIIPADQVSNLLEFVGMDGICYGFFGSTYNIEWSEDRRSFVVNCDDNTSTGDPDPEHGLSEFLNGYFGRYLFEDLTGINNGVSCNSRSSYFPLRYDVQDPIASRILTDQASYLNSVSFNGVNGQNNVKPGDLFESESVLNQNILTIKDNHEKLIDVKLVQKSSGDIFGTWWDCSSDLLCSGSVVSGNGYATCSAYTGSNTIGIFDINSSGELYFKSPDGQMKSTNLFLTKTKENEGKDCQCEESGLESMVGDLFVDTADGLIKYNVNNGEVCDVEAIPLKCIQFCDEISGVSGIRNVVAASMQTYSDDWSYDLSDFFGPTEDYNKYEWGERGKWREKASFVYDADHVRGLNGIDDSDNYAFNSGTFTLPYFSHHGENSNIDAWKKVTEITSYSANGRALEEKNILGIKSFAKYGYDDNLVYFLGKNSPSYASIFESFESDYEGNDYFEDKVAVPAGEIATDVNHTGRRSFQLDQEEVWNWDMKEITISPEILSDGIISKMWVHLNNTLPDYTIDNRMFLILTEPQSGESVEVPYKMESRAGEWILIAAQVEEGMLNNIFDVTEACELSVAYTYTIPQTEIVHIDDFRLQPRFSESMAYVYDPASYRVMAMLDDQNFATIYQYNRAGQLVRKQKETERGVKTLSEGAYNNGVKKDRNL